MNETLSTEPAAMSNSLLIRVGCTGVVGDVCGAPVSSRVESFTAIPTDTTTANTRSMADFFI